MEQETIIEEEQLIEENSIEQSEEIKSTEEQQIKEEEEEDEEPNLKEEKSIMKKEISFFLDDSSNPSTPEGELFPPEEASISEEELSLPLDEISILEEEGDEEEELEPSILEEQFIPGTEQGFVSDSEPVLTIGRESKIKIQLSQKDIAIAMAKDEVKEADSKVESVEDFLFRNNLNIFGEPRASELGPVVSISHSTIGEEEEEEEELSYLADQKIETIIDREFYLEELRNLKAQKITLQRKSGYLQKKMTEHFTKRKADHVFDEIDPSILAEMLTRYENKMLDLVDYRIRTQREREAIENEINEMVKQRDEQLCELDSDFSAMIAREKETATGLINTKTGKPISEKLIERLISHQRTKSTEIAHIRLAYIRRRNKVSEIETRLKQLDTIGGTLHLIDFEQLRMENQIFSDKIEERDDELLRLRTRFSNAVQALAHIRVKTRVIVEQTDQLEAQHANVVQDVAEIREYLNSLKGQRDANRIQVVKLKEKSGLLMHTKLLRHMEMSMHKIEKLKANLEMLMQTYRTNHKKLIAIRYNIENKSFNKQRKSVSLPEISEKKVYYSTRPTLTIPHFDEFDQLRFVN